MTKPKAAHSPVHSPATEKASPPLRKNAALTLAIESVNAKGFGVARAGGFVLLIDGALPGEKIQARVLKLKTRYGYAKIERVITPSPHRVTPPCPVSQTPGGTSLCGGCQFQHCTYTEQLRIKKQIVTDALMRIGGITEPPVADVWGMDNSASFLRYRNKAVFPVVPADNADGFAIGMYAARSHRVVEFGDCLLQHPSHVRLLAVVRDYLRAHRVPPYNETTHTGTLRQIMLRTSRATGEIMVVLVTNAERLPGETALATALIEAGASTVLLSAHTARGNAVLGTRFRTMRGKGHIEETIGDVRYRISPPSFFQVNSTQAKILYDTALEIIFRSPENPAPTSAAPLHILDAHAGAGGIALYAAHHALQINLPVQVTGIDIAAAAIGDAKKNAALNGITSTKFLVGAAEKIIPEMLANTATGEPYGLPPPGVVILDPPRRGCEAPLPDALIAARIPKVVYISCDPATLARDIKRLCTGGYVLEEVRPIDLFPLTGHIESIALLRLNK